MVLYSVKASSIRNQLAIRIMPTPDRSRPQAGAELEPRNESGPRHRPIETQRFTWRFLAANIGFPFLLTRLILIATGFIALNQMRIPGERRVWEIGRSGEIEKVCLEKRPVWALSDRGYWIVNIFSRWDSEWYLDIAKHGYHYEPGSGRHSNTAFFPLYPSIMAMVSKLTDGRDVSFLMGGLAISNLSLLLALGFLGTLVRLDFDDEIAKRTILYVLVFPSTCFFSAVYTESLFLAGAIAALYNARKGRWWFAGLAGSAATLTRPPGVLIFAPLALEYLHQRQFKLRNVRTDALALTLVPLAICLHFCYLRWKLDNFWIFLQTERDWGRSLSMRLIGSRHLPIIQQATCLLRCLPPPQSRWHGRSCVHPMRAMQLSYSSCPLLPVRCLGWAASVRSSFPCISSSR